MKLRQMAAAFLLNEEREILFLQKKPKDTFLAGLLVPIGGHMEESEISDPNEACIREVEEETGLKSDQITDLTLRYVVLRIKDNEEIRIQYVFFGAISKNATLTESDEGSLKWVKFDKVVKQNVSATTKEIVKHYHALGAATKSVFVGTMRSLKGKPAITWGLLEDWELSIFN